MTDIAELILNVHNDDLYPEQSISDQELTGAPLRSLVTIQRLTVNETSRGQDLSVAFAQFVRAFQVEHTRLLPFMAVQGPAKKLLWQARLLRCRWRGSPIFC
jgi:hypothetical protein